MARELASAFATKRYLHLIGGRLEGSDAAFGVVNPATGEVFAQAPDASRAQFEQAVHAARQAYVGWRHRRFEERRGMLARLADAMEARMEEMATLLTLEQGKPIAAARAEIERGIGIIRHVITIVIEPEVLRSDAGGRVEVRYKSLGVVGGIAPWNVPSSLPRPSLHRPCTPAIRWCSSHRRTPR
jgi:acyl-CoA reductase-like NAD-dependent aldehyde dehydrogenase